MIEIPGFAWGLAGKDCGETSEKTIMTHDRGEKSMLTRHRIHSNEGKEGKLVATAGTNQLKSRHINKGRMRMSIRKGVRWGSSRGDGETKKAHSKSFN